MLLVVLVLLVLLVLFVLLLDDAAVEDVMEEEVDALGLDFVVFCCTNR